jgi:hypothetical protein
MIRYPVEKNILRFYKYKFFESNEVITVEAFNRKQAREFLTQLINNTPELKNLKVISETVTLPIYGETTKMINDIEYVWVSNGWIPVWEFEQNENEL